MGATRLFRGVFKSIKESSTKGLRTAQLLVRGHRHLADVPVMENRGLVSMPKAGDAVTVMEIDDLQMVIASDSKDRPKAEAGETILYASETVFVRLNPDGSVRAQGSSDSFVEISPDGSIMIKGTKVTIEADQVANILSPKIGLGKDALLGTPLEMPVTTGCPCIFGVPHPAGAAGVTIPLVPAP